MERYYTSFLVKFSHKEIWKKIYLMWTVDQRAKKLFFALF